MPQHDQKLIVIPTPKSEPALPLTAAAFDALMEKCSVVSSSMAVAVSGGPDSMALAYCLHRWQKDAPLIAFIVDHQLRSESAAEAETTKQNLAALGIKAEILRWEHGPITAKLHSTARKARYELLLAACHRHGIKYLLLAHQQEDQAETILMRLAKGSGVDGLAGMAVSSTLNGVQLLRPLLTTPKAQLIATCATANIPYATDPSNSAAKFARGRLRRVMPLLENEGLTTERLTDLGDRAREAKDALDHYTQMLLRVALRYDLAGCLHLNLEQLRSAPRAVALRVLSLCLQKTHGDDYPPERSSLLPLLHALCEDASMPPRTLHGCLVKKGANSITFLREWTAITATTPIMAGQTVIWDGRWHVTLSEAYTDAPLTVRALGTQPHNFLDRLAPDLRHLVPQGRVRAALPGLWQKEKLVLIPTLSCDAKGLAKARLSYL